MTLKQKLISVIVPIYKVEKYLDKCVKSIINQTYKNLEIILVDDGSPDNCPALCDEYAKQDNRIKVIHKQNGGLSDARNCGIEVATGDFLFFVDSDDYITLDAIEILYRNLVGFDADISFANYAYVYDDLNSETKYTGQVYVYDQADAMMQFIKNNSTRFIVAWCKLIKKEILGNIRFPLGKLHEDEFTTHKIFYNANKVVYTDSTLYMYYQRADSIMGHKKAKNIIDSFDALVEKLDFYQIHLPNIYNEFAREYFGLLIKPYIQSFKFDQINKHKRKQMKQVLIERIKRGKKAKVKIKHYYRLLVKLHFPKIYYMIKKDAK